MNKLHFRSNLLVYFSLFSLCSAFTLVGSVEEEVIQEAELMDDVFEMDPLIVVGSNIDLLASQTFASILNFDYDDIVLGGNQTAIEHLRQLPSFVGASTSENRSNGGQGSAAINFYGIGNTSTITLINGRRAGGSGAIGQPLRPGGFSDLTLLSARHIKNVTIAKGNSSPIYGADAIAGTVDISLHNDFIGTRIDALYGNTTEDDAAIKQIGILFGREFENKWGKTHVTAGIDYYEKNSLYRRDRDLTDDADLRALGGLINFNSNVFAGRIEFDDGSGNQNLIPTDLSAIPTSQADYSAYNPFDEDDVRYNLNEEAVSIPGQEIKHFFGALEHEFNERITFFSDVLVSDNKTANEISPSRWDSRANPALLAAAQASSLNPLTDPNSLTVFHYRNIELGGFTQDWRNEAYRVVGGFRGTLDDRLNWETGLLYTESDITADFGGLVDSAVLVTEIQAERFNPFANNPASNTASLQAAEANLVDTYKERMALFDFKVDGVLYDLPAGQVKGAAGVEHRRESISFEHDTDFDSGTILGILPIPNYDGNREVRAAFGEVVVPIFAPEQNKKGLYGLDFNAAVRYESFDDEGRDPLVTTNRAENKYSSWDYKVGARYQPIRDITFRANYGTGFRAPTLNESFGTGTDDFIPLTDPTGQTPEGRLVFSSFRGNADLAPERSDNLYLGLTFEPEAISGLTITVDFYRIEKENAIANGAQFAVNQNAAGNPAFAGSVFRNPDGSLSFVSAQYNNVAELLVQGIEYEIKYRYEMGVDNALEAIFGANQFLTYKARPAPGQEYINFKGFTSEPELNSLSPGSIPTWKGVASLFWYYQDLTLGSTVNYIGSYDERPFSFAGANTPIRRVESYLTFDMVARYAFTESSKVPFLDGTTVTVGVNNLFDETPPFSAARAIPIEGFDFNLYNQRNRYWFISLSKEF